MNHWEKCIALLAVVQTLLEEMKEKNTDEYGLLESALAHAINARSDIENDQK